jgi:hypothetical protein
MIAAKDALRWACAFVAFNVYSLFLISAFEVNTAYLYKSNLAWGKLPDLRESGWGDHFIWRLFAGVVVTLLVGFLAGAIAKRKGALVAAVANAPSVVVWAVLFYILCCGDTTKIAGQTGFLVVSLIAIPLTTYLAYVAGKAGEEMQASDCPDNTVLGIWPYHWIWAPLPLSWYALGVVFAPARDRVCPGE